MPSTALSSYLARTTQKLVSQTSISFPILNLKNQPAAKWLAGTSCIVASIVTVGGITRLTKSGLSMVDWKPHGGLPPLTSQEWEKEFEKYKQFPEWSQRQSMTLSEFQWIYAWEYSHRMLGRMVGVVFTAGGLFLFARRQIPRNYNKRLLALLGLGATQGGIGWWMVKSGLSDDRFGDKKEIRVAPLRLAVHLSMAVTTFGLLWSTALDLVQRPTLRPMLKFIAEKAPKDIKFASLLRSGTMGLVGLTFGTIVSGAFVAGNDAGRAYNTFPKMLENRWIPPLEELFELQPFYKNYLENTALVQLNHRLLGTLTASTALTLASVSMLHPVARSMLSKQAQKGFIALGGVATAQMTLGVATLLNYVPIGLASMHQFGSLLVFGTGIYVVHSLKYVSPRFLHVLARRQHLFARV